MEKQYSRPRIEDVHIGYEYEWCGTSLQWIMFDVSNPEEHMKPLTDLHEVWTKKVIETEEDIKWLVEVIKSPHGKVRVLNKEL